MRIDWGDKTQWRLFAMTTVVVVLSLPVAVMAGAFLGLVEDFGVRHAVEAIRSNPGIFAEQYAAEMVFAGWASIVDIFAMAVIAGVVAIRRYGHCCRWRCRSGDQS